MKKSTKIILLIAATIVVAILTYFIFFRKPKLSSAEVSELAKSQILPIGRTASIKEVTDTFIGKTMYARLDGTKVFNAKDMSLYKTAKLGEWIGTYEKLRDNGLIETASGTRLVSRDWIVVK